ncbi:hypothetical protein [Streptomyces sp. NPDC047061]|uniref:hypothetical protein n=1 Tax=Streptomyces sp. NPDC047061 TaxID=3154605 RepID=UPI0033EB8E97
MNLDSVIGLARLTVPLLGDPASPDAGCITGTVIPVDGGTSASSGTPRPREATSVPA